MGPQTIIFHYFHNIHKNIAMTTFTPRHSTLFWELIWALNAANSSASTCMWSNWISMDNRLAVRVSSMAAFSFSNIITRHIFQALALATYLILHPFYQHCRQCPWPYCLNFWLSFGSLRQYFGLVRFMVDLFVPFQSELVGWLVGWLGGWLVGFRGRASVSGRYSVSRRRTFQLASRYLRGRRVWLVLFRW